MPINAAVHPPEPVWGAPGGQFPPPGYFFTQAECLRRIKSVIDFCQVDRKRLFVHFWHPPLGPKPVLEFLYNHEDPYSYIGAPQFDTHFVSWVAENARLFRGESSYKTRKLMEYVSEHSYLMQFFSIVSLRSSRRDGVPIASAIACLGSIHHSPRIFGRRHPSLPIGMHKADSYADLR